jgi:hypothetical protein
VTAAPFPKTSARLGGGQFFPHLVFESSRQRGKPTISCGNQRFQPGTQKARQNRRFTTTRNGDHDRGTINNRRHDESALFRTIHHIDRDVQSPCGIVNPEIQLLVTAGRKNNIDTFQMLRCEIGLTVDQAVCLGQFVESFAQGLRRNSRHPGAGTQHQAGLAGSSITATYNQAIATAQVQENR